MNNTFRQRCASALMHPVTLASLGVLLLNDLLLKALWPGAWVPGKLSDLAWMVFAPPVLAYVLSWLAFRKPLAERTAFAAAYVGLPLLYAAFNTFATIHDIILRMLGLIGGEGPRSPLDLTDSLVIPLAMAAALWVWHRRPLRTEAIRARLVLLAVVVAALASVASSYDANYGIGEVGRTDAGTLGARASLSYGPSEGYESLDGGLTWTGHRMLVPLERQEWNEREVQEPSRGSFWVDRPHIIRAYEGSNNREVVYSYEYLQSGGNRWMQALDKRDIENRVIATYPEDLFYDDQSGNLIVAMGLQGVVVVAPDGKSTRVAVGRYSPTDFSFGSRVRTFFGSLLHRNTVVSTGLAILLTLSFTTLALVAPGASSGPRFCFGLAAAISAFLAATVGVYPHVAEYPWEEDQLRQFVGNLALLLSGFGLFPLLLVIGGMAFARIGRRRVLAVLAASVGMLPPIAIGALVLFEAGPFAADVVAVMLVGLASFGLWAYRKRKQGV